MCKRFALNWPKSQKTGILRQVSVASHCCPLHCIVNLVLIKKKISLSFVRSASYTDKLINYVGFSSVASAARAPAILNPFRSDLRKQLSIMLCYVTIQNTKIQKFKIQKTKIKR